MGKENLYVSTYPPIQRDIGKIMLIKIIIIIDILFSQKNNHARRIKLHSHLRMLFSIKRYRKWP